MDWAIISQATFFLGIALLAIVVTIFVFASSLLGRSVEAHRNDQEELRKQKEQSLSQHKEELQKQLKESTTKKDMKRLREEIGKVEAEIAEFEEKSEGIKKSYEVFGVKGGVVYPALCFLASSILSGFAWSLARSWIGFNLGSSFIPITPILWLLALLAMGCGIERLYLSLKKIQEVAVTSEEAALKRTVEAFKIAQRELETEHKPELEIKLWEPKLPFKVKNGESFELQTRVSLSRGEIARQAFAVITVPKEFDLSLHEEWVGFDVKETKPDYKGYRSTTGRDVFKGVFNSYSATIKSPVNTGKFTFFYWAYCEECQTEEMSFQIEVV